MITFLLSHWVDPEAFSRNTCKRWNEIKNFKAFRSYPTNQRSYSLNSAKPSACQDSDWGQNNANVNKQLRKPVHTLEPDCTKSNAHVRARHKRSRIT